MVAQCLQDSAWWWLDSEKHLEALGAEKVILKQFTQILPSRGKEWVQQHQPAAFSVAIELMEGYLVAETPEPQYPNPATLKGKNGPAGGSPCHNELGRA